SLRRPAARGRGLSRPAPSHHPAGRSARAAGALPPHHSGRRHGPGVPGRRERAERRRAPPRPADRVRPAAVRVVLVPPVRRRAGGDLRGVRHRRAAAMAGREAARPRHGARHRRAARPERARRRLGGGQRGAHEHVELCSRLAVALRPRDRRVRRRRAVVLRRLQAAPQPADSLAHRTGRRGLLLTRVRGGETAVRALRDTVRDARSPRFRRQRRGPRPVPAVGVLHRLHLPPGRRSGRDVRPDAHATLAARAAGVTAPRPIDLRSDTVTRPSPAMRRAMADADVGDDVLDGDPTTRRLERRVAELLGQDDALFFPSGTQANQTGIALLTRPGTELVVEANAHLVHYELAGVAANWGVQIRPVATPDGRLTGDLVRGALRAASRHELAWEIRKRLGGGMRQSGILAAAALYALDCNLGRLPEDHENAKLLAERLSDCAAVRASEPESNIVMLDLLREGDTADS